MQIKNIDHNKNLYFGIKDGKLKHISEVENGLNCNCVCPACEKKLIARNLGEVRVSHFAHFDSKECRYGPQTAIHIAAKEIFERIKKIRVPEIKVFWNLEQIDSNYSIVPLKKYYSVTEKNYINIDSVILEKKLHDFIPDVVIISNNLKIIIEIAVTHFVGREKLEKIIKSNISTIEIDLSIHKNSFNFTELENLLIENIDEKNWLFSYPEEIMKSDNRLSNDSLLLDIELPQNINNILNYDKWDKIAKLKEKKDIETWEKEMDWNNDIEWE